MLYDKLVLSKLNHTWIIDIDGTILVHNGYKNGKDEIIESTKDFMASIPENDVIILLTSRKEMYREITVKCLIDNNIRFDKILFDIPMGERIVVNDKKPMGLETAIAINTDRDKGILKEIEIDENL